MAIFRRANPAHLSPLFSQYFNLAMPGEEVGGHEATLPFRRTRQWLLFDFPAVYPESSYRNFHYRIPGRPITYI